MKNNLRYIFALVLVLIVNQAWAVDLFTPVAGDLSMEWMKKLFGGLFGGSDALGGLVGLLNTAVLTMGGAITAYTVLAGTMQTAHEGEMGGRAFSSLWVPIRTVVGTALVVPVSGGYCMIQILVMWMIGQGVGLADSAWLKFTSVANLENLAVVNQSYVKANKLSGDVFISALCIQAQEVEFDKYPLVRGGARYAVSQANSAGNLIWNFGNVNSNPAECGSVQFPDSAAFYGQSGWDRFKGFFNKAAYQGKVDAIRNAHIAALEELISKSMTEARKAVETNNIDVAAINALSLGYERKLASSLGSAPNANAIQDASSSAQSQGWVMAGAIFMKIAIIQNDLDKVSINLPNSQTNVIANARNIYTEKFGEAFQRLMDRYNELNIKDSVAEIKPSNAQEESSFWSRIKDFASVKSAILNSLNGVQDFFWDKDKHIISQLSSLGGWCLAISGVLAGIAIGLGMVSFGSAAVVLIPFIITFFGLGVTLAYLLPMMPFLVFFGAAVGWVVLCAEAIIAAPLGFIMMLNPHANSLLGSSAQALRLLLSLMLRPFLIVFGFAVFVVWVSVGGEFLIANFAMIFNNSQADSNIATAILGKMLSPLILAVLVYQFFKHSVSIIHKLPDQVLQWLGGGGTQLGSYGEMGAAKTNAASAAMGAGAGALASGTAQLAGAISNDLKKHGGEMASLKDAAPIIPPEIELQRSKNEASAKNAKDADMLAATFNNEHIADDFAMNRGERSPEESSQAMFNSAVATGNQMFGPDFQSVAEKFAGGSNKNLASIGGSFNRLQKGLKGFGLSDEQVQQEMSNTAKSLASDSFAPDMSSISEKVESRLGKYEAMNKQSKATEGIAKNEDVN